MNRLLSVIGALGAMALGFGALGASPAAATTPATALTATSFTLHGSVAGGITQGHPGDVLTFSFIAKNTGATPQAGVPMLMVFQITNATVVSVYGFTACSFNGVADVGDGPLACEPGSWPHGQSVGVIVPLGLGNVVGRATARACVYLNFPIVGPCLTLAVQVL